MLAVLGLADDAEADGLEELLRALFARLPDHCETFEPAVAGLVGQPLDGDQVVGFVRGNFDPEAAQEEFRSCLWRINVAADAQGAGVGKFAVRALAEEARARGFHRLTVIWEPGEEGPEDFFLRIGFVITGETQYGENIGSLEI